MSKKKQRKVPEEPGIALDRRTFLGRVKDGALALGGFTLGAIPSSNSLFPLESRLRDMEYDKKFAEGLAALYSFANGYYTEDVTDEDGTRYLTESLALVVTKQGKSTGMLIGPYVLCTRHGIAEIVDENREISDFNKGEYVDHGRYEYPFDVIAHDKEYDLALLKINPREGFFSPANHPDSSYKLEVGRKIEVIGYTRGGVAYRQLGEITGVDREVKIKDTGAVRKNMFITNAYIRGGMSGGVLTDQNGTVLGIAQIGTIPEDYAAGVGWDRLHPFLQKAIAQEAKKILPDRSSR